MSALNPCVEDVFTALPCMTVFPAPESVFCASDLDKGAWHFMPLVSVELAAINPDWSGQIHLLNSCEPCEGVVGEHGDGHFNDWLQPSWIAFRLDAHSRYSLLGDWRYFALAQADKLPPKPQPQHLVPKDPILAHYQMQHASHQLAKARYLETGRLISANQYSDPHRDVSQEACALLDQLGGRAGAGNWANSSAGYRVDFDPDGDTAHPVAPTGEPFQFICAATAYNYCATGAGWVLLFYEPQTRTALLTFDWS